VSSRQNNQKGRKNAAETMAKGESGENHESRNGCRLKVLSFAERPGLRKWGCGETWGHGKSLFWVVDGLLVVLD